MAQWPGYFRFAAACAVIYAPVVCAQSIQFPSTTAPPTITAPPAGGAVAAPVNPYTGTTFSAAPFDPYSSSGSSAYSFWGATPPSNTSGVFAQPPVSPYGATSPLAPTYGPPAPSPYGATSPQYLFPQGMGQVPDLSQSLKVIQDLRFRQTYVAGGDDPTDLGINDSEWAITFTCPSFLGTGQPLYITPAFVLHLWDGPKDISADLPPSAYSAYLDFQWACDPNKSCGLELGFRVGVYTEFDTLVDESLRLQGLALGCFRLTPSCTFKIGAIYLDRNDIKVLPAGGLLWTPTPQVRFDFFFPQPRLSAYLTTIDKHEMWWYLAGEYGGGAWTIERAAGGVDSIDINDIRISAGVEVTGPQGVSGFFEAGFVFKRQVIYVVTPSDSFDPGDTWMVRAGISF